MSNSPTAVILGAGPGLGMSLAHRFGKEGYSVALVSRSADRHSGYLSSLRSAGVEAESFTADLMDRDGLEAVLDEISARFGTVDAVYYGPGAPNAGNPVPITEMDSKDAGQQMETVYRAMDAVAKVLPGMVERGNGALLFATGIGSITPMPQIGSLAVISAAMRNYATTLNAGLAGTGVYAGALTIGGAIERSDIYRTLEANAESMGDPAKFSLNPDEIADGAWKLVAERDRPEAVFNALG
ncbi:SDR family NAD(P)-dependent oxidoreductase [Salininema proteolyticum]|uniref:SDR family NAD(P)-dependent oxidoreductase n=1 Tax=Salininema proteolyticum TaxID=1607685 RepID=A0ABV8TTP7_9ACTN